MKQAEIPGLSAALVLDGRVAWSASFGARDEEAGTPVERDTVFEAASLSKPVFAYLVMKLTESGVLDLDRPLHEYLPYGRLEGDRRYRSITARMVLSHSAGLPNWGGTPLEILFEPGSGFGYSGEGYVYLQRVVEELTGRSLAELARSEVFVPFGMTRSSYVLDPRFEGEVATGYDAIGRAGDTAGDPSANAAASLLTTATDYASFVAAIVDRRGLEPGTWTTMTAPATRAEVSWAPEAANRRMSWALGWGVQAEDPDPLLWHWGDNGDFESFVSASTAERTGVVYFTNSTHGLAIAEAVAEIVFGRRHWGPSWAGYERFDEPERVARRELLRSFRERGTEDGVAKLMSIRAASPEWLSEALPADLGSLLLDADLGTAALAVLEWGREVFPDSRHVRDQLAEACLRIGELERSRTVYEELRASAPDAEAAAELGRKVRWIEARTEAQKKPPSLSLDTMRRLVGDYGARHLRIEGGELLYRRDGNPEYRLTPIESRAGTLVLQPIGLETFRLRLELGDAAPVARIIGLYFDGGTDESERSDG